MNFADRCAIAAGCLPKADYRTKLEALHAEMLVALNVPEAGCGNMTLPELPPPPIGALTSGEVALLRAWADDHAREALAQTGAEPVAEVGDLIIQVRERVMAAGAKNRDPLYLAATAQPAPLPAREPVACVTECEACFTPDACQLRGTCDHYAASQLRIATTAQPAPLPAREPLTDAQIDAVQRAWLAAGGSGPTGFARAIEAAHNITATPAAKEQS